MAKSVASTTSDKPITPRKARMLAIAGAAILVHAVLLLVFWPHRWPASYKWLLLPDAVGAYVLLGLGISNLKLPADKDMDSIAS